MGLSPAAAITTSREKESRLEDWTKEQRIMGQRPQTRLLLGHHCVRSNLTTLSSSSYLRLLQLLLLTNALLLSTSLLPSTHAFSLIQESTQRDCIDLICKEDALSSTANTLVGTDGQTPEECRACQQCTANGFSVCAKPKTFNLQRKTYVSNRACECAHSIPKSCKIPASGSLRQAMEPTSKLYSLCYLSVIRKPPAPLAVNDLGDVFVTIEPFWQTDYWRSLKPKNLTLIYKFPVTKREHCGGRGTLTNMPFDYMTSSSQSTEQSVELAKIPEFICNSSFSINMYSEDEKANKKAIKSEKEDEDYDNDVYDYENEELPPEVQFERDVFAGAKQAVFYYQIKVQRPNQLKMNTGGPAKFEDTVTIITSEAISFDLKPDVYGVGAVNSTEAAVPQQNQKTGQESLVKPATTMIIPAPRFTKSRPHPTPITPKSVNQWSTTTEAPVEVDPAHHKIAKVDILKRNPSDSPDFEPDFASTTPAAITSQNEKRIANLSGEILPSSSIQATSITHSASESGNEESSTIAPYTQSSTSPNTYGLKKHLNDGGQYTMVRNVFLATLLLCALLVLCICAYRQGWYAHFCGSTSKSGDTKNVNGKEYQAAASNGDNTHRKN